jgi:hypothetical protein
MYTITEKAEREREREGGRERKNVWNKCFKLILKNYGEEARSQARKGFGV